MGQIVRRRRKKGRPSKADLARRVAAGDEEPPEIRRSHRRRSSKYGVIDFDDYLDEEDDYDDDDDDEEDERGREKKLKLVVKLSRDDGAAARGAHARPVGEYDEERSDDEADASRRKKRRINSGDEEEEEEEEEDGAAVLPDGEDEEEEERAPRVVASKRFNSLPGTPIESRAVIPLPDKKMLEVILDKLQKKDTYGVYADPVDPEELPDYHDVIEHPMDFSTVRKNLAGGSYSTLDQLESDVMLICSNAMQYNSADTIYHKQARAIQELGRKKFEKLRIKLESSEKEMKLAQKIKTNSSSSVKKQIKKPLYQAAHEAVGSDFSAGATLATAGEILNSFNQTQVGGYERPNNNDAHVYESNSSYNDAHQEKIEEAYSARLQSKLGRKPVISEENRRSSYNISSQSAAKPDSVFMTFESEIKQLVAVGLHAEYAYARSLARFAATLGPIAWKAASQRIEQSLPVGCKFGRGWVGEYEPLPTPVLLLESQTQKQSGSAKKNNNSSGEIRMDDRAFKTVSPQFSEGRQSPFVPQTEAKPSAFSSSRPQTDAKSTGRKTGSNTANNAFHSQQTAQTRNIPAPRNHVPMQVELNALPIVNKSNSDLENSDTTASKVRETSATRHKNLRQSPTVSNGVGSAGFLDGRDSRNPRGAAPVLPKRHEQGINDPIQLMKAMADKNHQLQKPLDQPKREDPNNAAAAAARAWMSIGAGAFRPPVENPTLPKSQISADSLYNPAREFPVSGPTHQFPVPTFFPQPVHYMNEAAHFQNRPVMFPHMAAADLSSWRALSPHALPRQKQDTLPPDLNIGVQSPQSPVKQSSGVMVESQQPDLALQL